MRKALSVVVGMALATACGDSAKTSSADASAPDGSTALVQQEGDASHPVGDAASADGERPTDMGPDSDGGAGTDGALADAMLPDAGGSTMPDASAPDGAAPVFVPCTATKDITVDVA